MSIHPQTKQWLISIIKPYTNQQRTLTDAEQILINSRGGLTPKTDYYMTDNGLRVLLLTISGVLPILFNQQQYNIPIQIWFPLTYPVEPPFIFVTPTAQMIIKPNRSVDLSGRVMLPYITYWNQNNNMLECLAKMREVFSVEPPVMAKPTNNHAVNQTSPVSSRPNSMHLQNHPVARPQNQSVAPPIPKPPSYQNTHHDAYHRPTENSTSPTHSHTVYSPSSTPPPIPQKISSTTNAYQNPLPIPLNHNSHTNVHNQSVNTFSRSSSPNSFGNSPSNSYTASPPKFHNTHNFQSINNQGSQQYLNQQYMPQQGQGVFNNQPNIRQSSTVSLPAPIQPPKLDPEAEKLMKNKLELRKKLKQQVETFKSQSPIEINRLYSVQQQLVGHSSHIEQTIKQLKYVHNVLEQNATILQEKNMEIQKNIDLLKSKPNPDIDELLTPKHLLHQQLLECSCDVHTIDDVIYYLTKGFGSSSKDTTAFIKNIRTLSKEAFMKKALMEKIEGILINIP